VCGQVAPVNGFICHKQIGKTEEDGRGGKGKIKRDTDIDMGGKEFRYQI
jgi:hypothetical protein